MKATIDKAGRLVIPKPLREMAGLEPGTEVDIRFDEGRIEVVPPAPKGRIVYENGFAFWESGRKVTAKEIDDAVREAREERPNRIIHDVLGRDEDRS